MPTWLQAGLWGLIAGGALVVGAAIAWWVRVPATVIAGIMAFGAGVLISALAFELVDEAVRQGGAVATTIGFITGAIVYVAANALLDRHGARHRKRSGDQQPRRQAGGWVRRNCRQLVSVCRNGAGGIRWRWRIWRIVEAPTRWPRLSSSPWIR